MEAQLDPSAYDIGPVCAQCQEWNRTAAELWGRVLQEASQLEMLLPSTPSPSRETAAMHLQSLTPNVRQVSAEIRYLSRGCDQLIAFTPQEKALVDGKRFEFLSDANQRVAMLEQDVQMAGNLIAAYGSHQVQVQLHTTMQEVYAQRERLIQDVEASNRMLNERYLAILRGDSFFDIYPKGS